VIIEGIPPGLTTTIQLRTRTVGSDTPGANVGSPISGTSSGTTYTYSLGAYATGDYWCVLSGVSDPDAGAFPVRDDTAYPYLSWGLLDLITLIDDVVVTNVTQPTDADVKLIRPIRIGDDYVNAVGRAWKFDVNGISGYAAADLACRFGGQLNGVGWLVTGTVSTITGGIRLQFDLPKAATQDLDPGYYAWSAEVYTVVGGYEVTRVAGKVQLVEKQT
jgi:hypothetical protein